MLWNQGPAVSHRRSLCSCARTLTYFRTHLLHHYRPRPSLYVLWHACRLNIGSGRFEDYVGLCYSAFRWIFEPVKSIPHLCTSALTPGKLFGSKWWSRFRCQSWDSVSRSSRSRRSVAWWKLFGSPLEFVNRILHSIIIHLNYQWSRQTAFVWEALGNTLQHDLAH